MARLLHNVLVLAGNLAVVGLVLVVLVVQTVAP